MNVEPQWKIVVVHGVGWDEAFGDLIASEVVGELNCFWFDGNDVG